MVSISRSRHMIAMRMSITIIMIMATMIYTTMAEEPLVQMRGRQLFVRGQPYTIRGVCYSPVPVGESPNYLPKGDYFTARYAYMWKRDLKLIKRMGANTIRIYGWEKTVDHTEFLDEVYKNGLMILVTHYLGTAEENPVYTPDQRWSVIGSFLEQVARYNNHPAILMWSFGNELNGPWNLFTTQLSWVNGCGWTGGCMNSRDPNSPCMWQAACLYTALFTFINDACRSAKYISSRPCISGFADIDYFIGSPWVDWQQDKVPLFEHLLPDMDAWAMQLYRGKSFGGYFGNFATESKKALIVTEFGIDAYNDPCGWSENMQSGQVCFNLPGDGNGGVTAPPGQPFRGCNNPWAECAKPGAQTQAEWDQGLVKELMWNAPENGGVVAGGFIMAWTDEYWKGSNVQDQCAHPCPVQDLGLCLGRDVASYRLGGWASCGPHAHFTCGNYDTTYHDLCGYYLGANPDGYVNEEWFGLTEPVPCHASCPTCGYQLDALTLRPAYHAIKAVWNPYVQDAENSTIDLPPATCDSLRACYDCLQTMKPEQVSSGRCESLCKDPLPVLPLDFWAAYGVPIIAGISVLVVAALCVMGVLCWHRHGGDQTPLLEQGPTVASNYHTNSPSNAMRSSSSSSSAAASSLSSSSSSYGSNGNNGSSRGNGRMLRPSGHASAATAAEQRGLLDPTNDDESHASTGGAPPAVGLLRQSSAVYV